MRIMLVLVLVTGCSGGVLGVGGGHDAAADEPVVRDTAAPLDNASETSAALVDAAAIDVAVPDVLAADALTTGGCSVGPPGMPAWLRYAAYIDQREADYQARQSECFHSAVTSLRPWREDPDTELGHSLYMGLAALDDVAMTECLAALRGASCPDLARLVVRIGDDLPRRWSAAGFESCGRIVRGTVRPGGHCITTAECQQNDLYGCISDTDSCGYTCRPYGAIVGAGADCSVAGTYCDRSFICQHNPLPDGPAICVPAGRDGASCMNTGENCAAGFFCQHTTLASTDDFPVSACRVVELGTPCTGSWACPRPFACLGATNGQPGACAVGRPAGEPCAVQGVNDSGTMFSDCAFGLACLDVDGRGPRCFGGHGLGEPCGANPQAPTLAAPWCAEGYCAPQGAGQGRCHTLPTAGEACSGEIDCAPPGECRVPQGSFPMCIPVPTLQPTGGPCTGGDDRECGLGGFCSAGRCAPYRQVGEPCEGLWNECDSNCTGRCAPLLRCASGKCAPC